LSGSALAGRRIVVTRAPEQAGELMDRLRGAGAEVVALPMVQFIETPDTAELDRAIGELDHFDWVIFTSANAVRFFFRRARFLEARPGFSGKSLRSAPQYAVVGAATQKALEEEDLHASFTPRQSGATGATLALELAGKVNGKRVLVPRSDVANGDLLSALRKGRASVTAVEAYRTVAPKTVDAAMLDMLRRGDVDAVVFFSPSAVHNFARIVGLSALKELSTRAAFAAIGPTTAAAIRETRAAAVEAPDASADSLVAVLERHFASSGVSHGSSHESGKGKD
jgi:uroporphyrinogen III methyltransferase/synthase